MITATRRIEFGDFQTSSDLAQEITGFLRESGERPDAVVEPTCGLGSFLNAAAVSFPEARGLYGFDINPEYVAQVKSLVPQTTGAAWHLECRDFFQMDWAKFLGALSGAVLVVGNPPWVTNAALGALGSGNLPQKENFQRLSGLGAKTGKANFDISEWMLIRLLDALNGKPSCVAMLCKTGTARKTLRHAWLSGMSVGRCSLHLVDAKVHFGASVDACLLVVHTGVSETTPNAGVYPSLSFDNRMSSVGLAGKELVSDMDEYQRLRDIDGNAYYRWRSGVKHDAASVMEFTQEGEAYANGLGEVCDLEETYLFPLLKSSDIANGRLSPERFVLLTQQRPSDDTALLERAAPKTWRYLLHHADALDGRRSIIYEKRPRFSVFGVGEYTFAPWKVAVSGLYKSFRFGVVGRYRGKPIVLDDTCYSIPCHSEAEARLARDLLNSEVCQRFLRAVVFLDAKRPVTSDVLNRIDLRRIAERLRMAREAERFLCAAGDFEEKQPLMLLEEQADYPAKTVRKARSRRRR